MLLSLRKNGLTSLFKEVRVFKDIPFKIWGVPFQTPLQNLALASSLFSIKSSDPSFRLENTKSPPPRKSQKITQKLGFGPPRACPANC